MKNLLPFIEELLTNILDSLKQKNTRVFTVVAGLLLAIYYSLNHFLVNDILIDKEVEILGMTFFLVNGILNAIVFLLTILGVHTVGLKKKTAIPGERTDGGELPAHPAPVKTELEEWKANKNYPEGRLITQHGYNYRAKLTHLSSESNTPTLDTQRMIWERV